MINSNYDKMNNIELESIYNYYVKMYNDIFNIVELNKNNMNKITIYEYMNELKSILNELKIIYNEIDMRDLLW